MNIREKAVSFAVFIAAFLLLWGIGAVKLELAYFFDARNPGHSSKLYTAITQHFFICYQQIFLPGPWLMKTLRIQGAFDPAFIPLVFYSLVAMIAYRKISKK